MTVAEQERVNRQIEANQRRFLQREHPDVAAARMHRHSFEPMLPVAPRHTCTAGCFCERCWLPKSHRIHPRRARSLVEGVPA